jgi:hypothetical protein
VNILLRKDGASIDGTVREENGNLARAFVVLAPKSRVAAHLFRTTTPDSSGAFHFAAIAPGEYDLIAFDRNDDDSYLDYEVLGRYGAKLTHLTLLVKESRSVELKVVPVTSQ